METLSEMERIEVDNKDRPIEDIVLIKAQVFVDPYQEADEQVRLFCNKSLLFLLNDIFTVGERERGRTAKSIRRRTSKETKSGVPKDAESI